MKDVSVKDLVTWMLVVLGFAVQWGAMGAKVEAMQKKIDSVAEIQGDLKALKEITSDSRNRIVRIEDRLLKASR